MFTVVLRRRDRSDILMYVMVHWKAINCAAIRADKFFYSLDKICREKNFLGVKTSLNPLACSVEWTIKSVSREQADICFIKIVMS